MLMAIIIPDCAGEPSLFTSCEPDLSCNQSHASKHTLSHLKGRPCKCRQRILLRNWGAWLNFYFSSSFFSTNSPILKSSVPIVPPRDSCRRLLYFSSSFIFRGYDSLPSKMMLWSSIRSCGNRRRRWYLVE